MAIEPTWFGSCHADVLDNMLIEIPGGKLNIFPCGRTAISWQRPAGGDAGVLGALVPAMDDVAGAPLLQGHVKWKSGEASSLFRASQK
jgi:hypothetical protein